VDTFYPSLFDSEFSCFVPPRSLTKVNLEDFEKWSLEYNAHEVLRFVFISHLTDMIYLLHFMGDDGFTEEEVQGYLSDFGNDRRLNNPEFIKQKLKEVYAEWIEISTATAVIRDCLEEVWYEAGEGEEC
jgi:hypothetical protein